jgi:steroid delta-isomerase-like uncharacterized protein
LGRSQRGRVLVTSALRRKTDDRVQPEAEVRRPAPRLARQVGAPTSFPKQGAVGVVNAVTDHRFDQRGDGCMHSTSGGESHSMPENRQSDPETPTKNAEIVRRLFDVLNTGDVVAAVQFYAPDALNHGRPVGREGFQRVLSDIHATFPDQHVAIDDLVAVDNAVVIRTTVTGTHTGVGRLPVNGGLLVGVPPTGRRYKVQHIHWHTLRDGLIVEHRANRDDVGMLQQLGLLPTSSSTPSAQPVRSKPS